MKKINKIININQIIDIKLYYEQLTEYEFSPATKAIYKKYLWGLYKRLVKERKSNRWEVKHKPSVWLSEEEIKRWEGYKIDENRLYIKPHIIIKYTNYKESFVYFNTNDELNKYVNDLQTKYPQLIL